VIPSCQDITTEWLTPACNTIPGLTGPSEQEHAALQPRASGSGMPWTEGMARARDGDPDIQLESTAAGHH
jgi:hypothetical protein